MAGRKALQDTTILKVPSSNPLTYCRLCFSTRLCKTVISQEDALHWIDYIQRTVGIGMKVEEDAPFAICLGCKMTLESVEQFRFTCRLHDTALRHFREQAHISSNTVTLPIIPNTDGGESSTATAFVEKPATTDDSADDSNSASKLTARTAVDNMCLVCNMKLPSLGEYRKHMKNTHNKTRGIVPCPLCPRRFRKDFFFQRHLLTHTDRANIFYNGDQVKKLKKCRFCGEMFHTGKKLGKHEQEMHGLSFECRLCFKRFATEHEKNVHRIMHLAGREDARSKKFKCKVCSRVFPNRHCLNIHVNKHEKCFMCWTCGTKFARLDSYVEHQTTVHQSKPILEECIECKMVFSSREEFLSHLDVKHMVYDSQDLASDEFSDTEQTKEFVRATAQQSGVSQRPEPETVSVSSDDFPIYMEDDDEDDNDLESSRRGVAITSKLEEELMLEEVPRDTGFDLYGKAFQPQISGSLIEELSD